MTHSAINHVDLLYACGVHQNNRSGLVKPPFTLGLEFSGIVLDTYVAEGHSCAFSPGDKVWGSAVGSHAEEIIVPASVVRHLPSSRWSLADMAALGAATTPVSYGALTFIAQVKAGETVLVHAAAGGLGIYAVQIARALGAKVIGTVGSNRKIPFVENLLRCPQTGRIPVGEGVVNYTTDGWEKQVLSICKQDGRDGVDVVFDSVGLVQRSIKCTTFNGRIVIVGFAGRTGTGAHPVQDLERIPTNRILLKQIKLLGYRFGETRRRMPDQIERIRDSLDEMLAGEPRAIQPIVHKMYRGLDSVSEAMMALRKREVWGKAVVEVQSEDDVRSRLRRSHSVGGPTAGGTAKL